MGENQRNQNIFPWETVSWPCGLKRPPPSPCHTRTSFSAVASPVWARHGSFQVVGLPHPCLWAVSVSEFIFWNYDRHKSLCSSLEACFPHRMALGCIRNERNRFWTQGLPRQLPGRSGPAMGTSQQASSFPKVCWFLHFFYSQENVVSFTPEGRSWCRK